MLKAFNKPYLKVVNLEQNARVSTACVVECSCDIDTCTCNMVCDCVGYCALVIDPSK